ncbi:MAG: thioredoxin domain-containing protein [Acidimicrobiia bacterium]|nr:thioredoxin domain-containing protein [Acidimicrobiia bacterium]
MTWSPAGRSPLWQGSWHCLPRSSNSRQTTSTTAPAEAEGTYNGLPVGFTDDGYPYLGDPDAPVSLVEFSDYLCPFCGRHATQTNPQLIEQYAASGQVRFVFWDYPLAELHPTAPSGHAAALCIAEQGAALFWAMHDQLFAGQSEWTSLFDNSDYLAGVAEEIGADLDAYQACLDSGRTVSVVDQRVAQARQLGFSGTPGFQIVDNRTDEIVEVVGAQPVETFVAAIDAVISGETPVATDPPEDKPDLPLWASEDGLAPDPERPGYTLAGDAYRGNPEADLVVIEISDFQCPFCQRHTLETQPDLNEQYIDTGQVMWVFKHMPLPFHPQALAAATAAECAGDQQAFWGMHDLLFERVDDWAVEPPDTVLVELAGELGLDEGVFASCVGSRTALERVVDDLYDTSEVFGSTPTFVVLFDGWASVIDGAQPFEEFVAAFEEIPGE